MLVDSLFIHLDKTPRIYQIQFVYLLVQLKMVFFIIMSIVLKSVFPCEDALRELCLIGRYARAYYMRTNVFELTRHFVEQHLTVMILSMIWTIIYFGIVILLRLLCLD